MSYDHYLRGAPRPRKPPDHDKPFPATARETAVADAIDGVTHAAIKAAAREYAAKVMEEFDRVRGRR